MSYATPRLPVISRLPLGLLLFLAAEASASLPYTPTKILTAPKSDGHLIYIVDPPSPSWPHGRISRLFLTSHLRSDSLPTTTISSSLPFLESDPDAAFTSVITQNGSISVYAGECSRGSRGSSLWQIAPSDSQTSWIRQRYTVANMEPTNEVTGANWLSYGIAFSSDAAEPDNLYFFGGMCPTSAGGGSSSWTEDATYSNQLLVFQAQAENNKFDFMLTPGHGQPTPEAGFTITPLNPTHSRTATGSITQQQDFVLIGGHTATAFIGMDMIALFSLPQSSWTFVNVETPGQKNDLALRNQYYVDSRSGHSTVLTSDGQRLIVFGGWVGDISKPAKPQLTVLEVGAGYGGSGSWKWSDSLSSPLAPGEGLFGHGAVMLPGDIMLVTGGFSNFDSYNSNGKRSLQSRNTKNYFLNTTSGKWLHSYDMAKGGSGSRGKSGHHDFSGALDSNNEKAGLGAGLGFGLLALICIIFFFVCYRKRMKREREEIAREDEQEREIEEEKNSADFGISPSHDGVFPHLSRTIDGRGASVHASSIWDRRHQPRPQQNTGPHESAGPLMRDAQRSGVDLNIPSPNRGLRHSIARRPVGHNLPGPRFDDSQYHWNARDMHAIEERDEENSSTETSRQPSIIHAKPDVAMVKDSNNADPFRDPDPDPFKDPELESEITSRQPMLRRARHQVSRPASENRSPAEDRQREMEGWIRDWAAVDAASQNQTTTTVERYSPTKFSGRSSPSKSDRTESNLSDKSSRSNYSARSATAITATSNAPSRNGSSGSGIRSYLPNILPAILTNPFALSTGVPSTIPENVSINSQPRSPAGKTSNGSHPDTSSGSGGDGTTDRTDSFATAKSAISYAHTEHEALLAPNVDVHPDIEPTFTRKAGPSANPVRAGRPGILEGWVGSVRRGVGKALTATVTGRATSLTNETTRYRGVIGSDGYYEYSSTSSPMKAEDENRRRSGSNSPTKKKRQSLPSDSERISFLHDDMDADEDARVAMKRSVSDGGAFWTAKRGARDWDADTDPVPSIPNIKVLPASRQTTVPLPLSQGTSSSNEISGWRSHGAWKREAATSTGVSTDLTAGPSTGGSTREGRPSTTSDAASDWDVEAAVEQRVVQVMFTVPREKLRVVNADVEVASLISSLREDEEWTDGNRDLNAERIWAIAENNIMSRSGEASPDLNTSVQLADGREGLEGGRVEEVEE